MNLSTFSQSELVVELLSTTMNSSAPLAPCIEDARMGYVAPELQPAIVAHKLDVARELLLRNLKTQMQRGPVMDSPDLVRDWLRLKCASLDHEVFLVLYLNAQHSLIDVEPMFRGTLTQTSVYPREVVKAALTHNAAAVILAHNHPSGSPEPSRADEFLTQTLKSKCQAWHLALNDKESVMRSIVAKR